VNSSFATMFLLLFRWKSVVVSRHTQNGLPSGTNKMKRRMTCLLLLLPLSLAATLLGRAQKETVSIKGYVLDSACAFTKDLKKPVSKACAESCAAAGSPLVILTEDGAIYWPISDRTPASGQNAKLLPFAAQRVVATGKVYDRGGSHAIVIERVAALSESK
jgi:hypothetical protein